MTPFFGLKTTIEGTYEDTNLNGQYKDTKVLKSKLKVDYPIPPVTLGVQYDSSQTEDKVADPSLGRKDEDTKWGLVSQPELSCRTMVHPGTDAET